MTDIPLPFWEKAYRRDDITAFSPEPNAAVMEYAERFSKDASILEVGCGEGQNVLHLARHGFTNIDAFDLSEAGIARLQRYCEANRLTLNAFVQDLTTFVFARNYDWIMSFATLCFVPKENWRNFLLAAREHTNAGGIHIMHLFTNAVPPSPDIAPYAVGLAEEGELESLYSDWEILRFQAYQFEDEHPGVPRHTHAVNKIVARKPNH